MASLDFASVILGSLGLMVLLLMGTVTRLRVPLFVLGALLPIWSVGNLPPLLFDAARYGLGALIVLRLWGSQSSAKRALSSWAAPLTVSGVLLLLFVWLHGNSPYVGAVMVAAAVSSWAIVLKVQDVWPIFLGFAVGASASAFFVIGSFAEVPLVEMLVPNKDPGYERFTGLGSSSVRVSVEFAIAMSIWLMAYSRRWLGRVIPVAGIVISSAGLLLCGGRTGVLGLGIALVVALIYGWVGVIPTLLFISIVLAAIWVFRVGDGRLGINTIDRILSPADDRYGGITTGRLDIMVFEWGEFVSSPLIGAGATNAHFAPLYYAVLGGLVPGLVIVWLSLRMLGLVGRPISWRNSSLEARSGVLVISVFVATVLVEPLGPFLGFGYNVLLFSSVAAIERQSERAKLV